ncbi:MAG: ATP-grasp domain-containing protein [Patescibacteria group bacterium]|nr:ATP-grasp domain-containing protein [Patescibacteria group bacterium]
MTDTNSRIWTKINSRLGKHRFFYVCRDWERAAAILGAQKCFIITNYGQEAKKISARYKNIILIKEKKLLDTNELLAREEIKSLVKKNDFIVVFKNTPQIEKICARNGWKLLNPPSVLAEKVETKISQVKWLGNLSRFLPPHKIIICKNIKWKQERFILQFNRAHTGGGTILVKTEKQLNEIKNKFPLREARVSDFVEGPVFTNNNIVWNDNVLCGNINYQITGLTPFTDRPFATIGNDWALPNKILSKKQINEYQKIANLIGKKLSRDGWKGLFGIDIVMDKKTGKLYLLEINARQPASTTYESQLQKKASSENYLTTFEAHLGSLLKIKYDNPELTEIKNGSQIVRRITENKKINNTKLNEAKKKLMKNGFNAIAYENTEPGSDLLRIQIKNGIMTEHNKLNEIGKLIKKCLN